jgi:flavorubredoxin
MANAVSPTELYEVCPGVFRLSTWDEAAGITFNQFLIQDDKPTLIETGENRMFEAVKNRIAEVLDPASLCYIVVPHFEGDECGSLNAFLRLAPQARPICSQLCAMTSLTDYSVVAPLTVEDQEVIEIGKRRLRFVMVPHCHNWESLIVYEESAKLLFSSDLFIQMGRGEPVTEADLSNNMLAAYRQYTPIAPGKFLLQAADKIAALELAMLLPMHGSAIAKNYAPYLRALREYALEG